jgi:hypothetical protein
MLPEKVYMYHEPTDTIVTLSSSREECKNIYNPWTKTEKFYVLKRYCTDSFEVIIDIDEEEVENWKETTDLKGNTIFKSLQDAKNLREKIILEKYFWYQNKLYCSPKFIG